MSSVDIPREAPRKFVMGGGKAEGRIDELFRGIGCGWRMSRLRWLATWHVNITTPSTVRFQNTGCTLSLSRALEAGSIGGNVMRMSAHDTGVSTRCVAGHVFLSRKVPP
ncbi:uncharacterized protein LACBIDRAFT_312971 [Laccaria bicolor S238N-H82]|uniref:Predicted protein n=1 Tax=Laccaria bicolor (strain S238N-H82 / ATCC MYA-4686) TaxID=486041 RepID=B0DSR1_LACBS|nr:uncharacterized protein LACBIDRAFT_309643 [Laccaria bicolor S238N-H82]XP_001888539.1 uncharacterized protein LACBIDRAFT_312971 [Laccaria bicolor S238N-H82]EDR00747.1 predicted protein [Laccaria bicolor S238N-H82]EDR02281.1 predicted protein [Laccaria bicolor S238N-H82]|eukprot:XP_001886958.1 predicted protein [Laccaria bicolor S238N-H82]